MTVSIRVVINEEKKSKIKLLGPFLADINGSLNKKMSFSTSLAHGTTYSSNIFAGCNGLCNVWTFYNGIHSAMEVSEAARIERPWKARESHQYNAKNEYTRGRN